MLRPSGRRALLRGRRRRPGAGRQSGIALILTLLVLAILIVLTVQLVFSVKIEERIVRNTQDDAALELAGARGSVPLVAALFRDDRKNGTPSGAPDTLADIMFDPKTPDARKFAVGDVQVTLEMEDAERRLPLAWLADQNRAALTEVALKRLIEKLAPVQGDAAAFAKTIAERIRGIEGVTLAAPGAGGTSPQQPTGPASRRFTSLEQLADEPAQADASGGGASGGSPSGSGSGGGASGQAAGIDRRVLYGDPEAKPPTTGIAPFVTTWPVGTVNLNTVLPEVLFALLPEKDKADQPLWGDADAIVEAVRKHRIDPQYQESQQNPPEGGAASSGSPVAIPEAGQGQGASKAWGGQAFTEVTQLQSAAIHPKLEKIFTAEASGGGGGGGGGTPAPAAAGGGTQPGQAFTFQAALGVNSRCYVVRVKARVGEGDDSAESVYRLVVLRNAQDEVTPLFVAEVGAR